MHKNRYAHFKLRYLADPVYLLYRARSLRSPGDLAGRLKNLVILFGKIATGRYGENYWRRRKKMLLENYGAMKETVRDRNLHREAAQAFLESGNHAAALEAYAKLISMDPGDASLHLEAGKIHLARGNFERAREEFLRAHECGHRSAGFSTWIGAIGEVSEPRRDIPPYRIFFTWGMSYECNYRCSYCHAPKKEDPGFERNGKWAGAVTDVKRIAEAWDRVAGAYGGCRIRLDGGEPSLHPGFFELIRRLSIRHRLHINSNLSFDIGRFCRETDPRRVRVDASFHPEHVPLEEFLQKTETLDRHGFRTIVSAVAYPPFIDRLAGYRAAFEAAGIHFVVHPYSGDYRGQTYPAEYTGEEIAKIYTVDRNSRDELEWRKGGQGGAAAPDRADGTGSGAPTGKRTDPGPPPVAQRRCRMGQMYARIYPNGDAYRCCTNDGMTRLGNLYDGSFKLLDTPAPCDQAGCRCWRCMVVGDECRWITTWIDDWEMPF